MNKAELIAAMAEKSEMTKKDSECALNAFIATVTESLQKGERVDENLVPGIVTTPEIPLSVFDKEKMNLPSGSFEKLHFNPSRFLQYLQTVVEANQTNAQIENKVIVGSQFYKNLQDALRRLENNEVVHDSENGDYVGIFWLYDGRNCPIHIPAEQVPTWITTIKSVIETSLQPKSINSEITFDEFVNN